MTARQFANTCPDCDRWRCMCNDDEQETRSGPGGAESARAGFNSPLLQPTNVRTGPPPPATRERLAALRAEYLARLGEKA